MFQLIITLWKRWWASVEKDFEDHVPYPLDKQEWQQHLDEEAMDGLVQDAKNVLDDSHNHPQ